MDRKKLSPPLSSDINKNRTEPLAEDDTFSNIV